MSFSNGRRVLEVPFGGRVMTDTPEEDALTAQLTPQSSIAPKSLVAVGILTFLLIFSFLHCL